MQFERNVSEYINKRADDVRRSFIDDAPRFIDEASSESGREVVSPLEQIFMIEWRFLEYVRCCRFPFDLVAQYGNDSDTGKYFLDFQIFFLLDADAHFDTSLLSLVNEPLLAVEIDGHEFHEKTKRQVEYHKARERFLVSKGWQILRFAGTEVYKDAEKCVSETIRVSWEVRSKYFGALHRASLNRD